MTPPNHTREDIGVLKSELAGLIRDLTQVCENCKSHSSQTAALNVQLATHLAVHAETEKQHSIERAQYQWRTGIIIAATGAVTGVMNLLFIGFVGLGLKLMGII